MNPKAIQIRHWIHSSAVISPRTLAIASCLLLAAARVRAESNVFLREFPTSGALEFRLEDQIRDPRFVWPRTLLDYRVRFSSPPNPTELRLVDRESGKQVPFQISSVAGNTATVSFFSDLPSGGLRRFALERGKPEVAKPGVTTKRVGGEWLIDGGRMSVRIPAETATGNRVPGPVLGLKRFGESVLVSPVRTVSSIQTTILETGPLFVTARVIYQFAGGGSYGAEIRVIHGYEYIGFREEMRGLPKGEGIYMEMSWTGFKATHRMVVGSPFGGTRRLGDPMIQPFRGEDPAFTGPTRIEDPAVEMLPALTPYWPNGWGGNRSASFWDENSGDAMGLFIADCSQWQDNEYAIWTSADTLRVKYRHDDKGLHWKWPLATGTRSTGLTVYQHEGGKPADAGKPAGTWEQEVAAAGNQELPVRLQIFHGDISLNRVKDWVLAYPAGAPTPPTSSLPPGRQKSLTAYLEALPKAALMDVSKGMFHPVGLRDMGYWVVPDFLRFRAEMNAEQRAKATASILLAAYVAAEDEYAPMRTMLGGHPNFMSDLKYPLAAAAFLFPSHPMAAEWRDQFGKFVELCGRYYVRPAVPEWEALGGRFTESIATYQWAFLGPVCEANRIGSLTGARNFLAQPRIAELGDYLTGILTSPQLMKKGEPPQDAAMTGENGFRRIHPPQGAHSGRRGPPGSMYELGEQLMHYRPLTAEHLMWGGWPAAGKGFEDRTDRPITELNHGTNPRLKSAKFTGYGIVMRAGVDTPDEISLFVQQVDKGPNYRWGYANQNGSGNLYFYAGGNSYCGHEREEAGDGHVDDALLSSNTGVYKDWAFRCIGMNELTRPFYDLGTAQFAELVPETGPGAYSWPEYQSRNVMLVGTDYFITHDQILDACGTRFAWNISRDDRMPFIHPIKGADGSINLTDPKDSFIRGRFSTMIKSSYSNLAMVTHKPEVRIIPHRMPRGVKPPPFVRIATAGSEDLVFRTDEAVAFSEGNIKFSGTAGVIRCHKDGITGLALFQGNRIGANGVVLESEGGESGVSASFRDPSAVHGQVSSRSGFRLKLGISGDGRFYLDGLAVGATDGAFRIPPGNFRWEWTRGLPEPMPPVMLRTENHAGGATVFFRKGNAAERHRIETSSDNGASWQVAGETRGDNFDLTGIANGKKIHVRAVALNAEREGLPAAELPLYVTSDAPPPPDGLRTEIRGDGVHLTWGEILGVTEYRLYRRKRGEIGWQRVFEGLANGFHDPIPAPLAFSEPGLKAAAWRDDKAGTIHEYAVAAVNPNGEGAKSLVADTDPSSWLNWNPTPDFRFKRQTGFWLPPYVRPVDVPPAHYPGGQ